MTPAEGPRTRSDCSPDGLALVKATCLDLATYLGDFWDDLVIVGGYVPSLLVPARGGVEAHPGTLDVDLALSLAMVEGKRYQELADRLRRAGYSPDRKGSGEPVRYRWRPGEGPRGVTVDFLVQNPADGVRAGGSLHLAHEFAPIRSDVVAAAFRDRIPVTIEGRTLHGEQVRRTVQVCGPAAFVVLKAHALRSRGFPKDAFDLYYMVRNYGDAGPPDVAARWDLVGSLPATAAAITILRDEFATQASLGPRRVARFLEQGDDEEVLADAVGYVQRLLRLVT